MHQALSRTILQFSKKHGFIPGIISVLHTFGKQRKFHPHFHVLRTNGGMPLDGSKWIDSGYIPEAYLKKAWKSKLLNRLRSAYRKNKLWFNGSEKEFYALLNFVYQKDWHLYIRPHPVEDSATLQYIGRYIKRPSFPQKYILDYKKGEYVKLGWKSSKQLPKFMGHFVPLGEFINSLIVHIPDYYERHVFYSGLYSPYQKKRLYADALRIFKKNNNNFKPLSWQKLRKLNSGKDPLVCPYCGGQLKFLRLITFDFEQLKRYVVENYQLVLKPDTS
jgi:hypothetical protein